MILFLSESFVDLSKFAVYSPYIDDQQDLKIGLFNEEKLLCGEPLICRAAFQFEDEWMEKWLVAFSERFALAIARGDPLFYATRVAESLLDTLVSPLP